MVLIYGDAMIMMNNVNKSRDILMSKGYNSEVKIHVLFISYKFVKGFLAITFYYLFFRTETFMMCVNVFYITRSKISVGSDKK